MHTDNILENAPDTQLDSFPSIGDTLAETSLPDADAIDFDMQPNIDFPLALKEQARLNAYWETMN